MTQTLFFQTFGTQSYTATTDLDFTLQTLNLNAFSNSTLTISSTLAGTLAFTGATAAINQNGTGGTSTISAPVVLGSTIGASGLQVLGVGQSNTTISGVISSSSSTGGPLQIGVTDGVVNAGVVTLGATNTFAGGVVLKSGNLALTGTNAPGIFGNTINTLTIGSGTTASTGTVSGTATIINPVVIANASSNFVITGGANNVATTLTIGGLLGNGVSGPGGVIVQPAGTASVENFQGINTYTGSTSIGPIQYATVGTPGASGVLRLQGARTVDRDFGRQCFGWRRIRNQQSAGDSVNDLRVSATTPVNVTSGVVNVIGVSGYTNQAFGQMTAAGATSIGIGAAGGSVGVTITNLIRSNNGTVMISGANLGNAAAAPGVSNATVTIGQINGAAPASALVGGAGAAGTTTISIIPWATGDLQNAVTTASGTATTTLGFGSGFVTYDVNGVRLLNATTEYNANFGVNATDNVRPTASVALAAPTTENSVFVATNGLAISGSALSITSGALASNVAATTISAPVAFGASALRRSGHHCCRRLGEWQYDHSQRCADRFDPDQKWFRYPGPRQREQPLLGEYDHGRRRPNQHPQRQQPRHLAERHRRIDNHLRHANVQHWKRRAGLHRDEH